MCPKSPSNKVQEIQLFPCIVISKAQASHHKSYHHHLHSLVVGRFSSFPIVFSHLAVVVLEVVIPPSSRPRSSNPTSRRIPKQPSRGTTILLPNIILRPPPPKAAWFNPENAIKVFRRNDLHNGSVSRYSVRTLVLFVLEGDLKCGYPSARWYVMVGVVEAEIVMELELGHRAV